MKRPQIFIIIVAGTCFLSMAAFQSRVNNIVLASDESLEQRELLNNELSTHVEETSNDKQKLRTYKSSYDFPLKEIILSDNVACEFLKKAYECVDFYGSFEKGDLETYEYYKQNFLRLLNNEIPFIRKKTGDEIYVYEFDKLKSADNTTSFTSDNYQYQFFDMDEDGTPELCIEESYNSTYIFKYISDKDEFLLLHELEPSYYQLNGSNKIRWDGTGGSRDGHVFYRMDGEGKEEYAAYFFSKGIRNEETDELEDICMIGLPHYINKNEENNLPEDIKKQAYFDESHEIYYFRVSEEQYNDLSNGYWNAANLAKENIKDVTYNYYELFGNLLNRCQNQ